MPFRGAGAMAASDNRSIQFNFTHHALRVLHDQPKIVIIVGCEGRDEPEEEEN
jgi:hypothetical protein